MRIGRAFIISAILALGVAGSALVGSVAANASVTHMYHHTSMYHHT